MKNSEEKIVTFREAYGLARETENGMVEYLIGRGLVYPCIDSANLYDTGAAVYHRLGSEIYNFPELRDLLPVRIKVVGKKSEDYKTVRFLDEMDFDAPRAYLNTLRDLYGDVLDAYKAYIKRTSRGAKA